LTIDRFYLKKIEYKKILCIFIFLYLLALPAILCYNTIGKIFLSVFLVILSYATYDFIKNTKD
jgi:hypothetical protein